MWDPGQSIHLVFTGTIDFDATLLPGVVWIDATRDGRKLRVTWDTWSEDAGICCYEVLRADDPGGPFFVQTPAPLPAIGGAGQAATYAFVDEGFANGQTVHYLIALDDGQGGSTQHGVGGCLYPVDPDCAPLSATVVVADMRAGGRSGTAARAARRGAQG